MSEISRRLGMARRDFEVLQILWKHNSLSRAWKLRIFEVCTISKLLYGLVTTVSGKAERGRLEGLQARSG